MLIDFKVEEIISTISKHHHYYNDDDFSKIGNETVETAACVHNSGKHVHRYYSKFIFKSGIWN